MKIKTKLRQHRRDFTAIYQCERCGFEHKESGYDDANFHHNVIPEMVCPDCGEVGRGPSSSPDVPAGVVL